MVLDPSLQGGYGNADFRTDTGTVLVGGISTGSVFEVDPYTGVVSTLATGISGDVMGVVHDPVRARVYAGNTQGEVWEIDPATGVASLLLTVNGNSGGVADLELVPAGFGAYGGLLLVSGAENAGSTGWMGVLDPAGPTFTPLVTGTGWLSDLEFDGSGTLWAADHEGGQILTIDAAGSVVYYAILGLVEPGGLAWDETRQIMWVADDGSDLLVAVDILGLTGTSNGSFEFDSGWYPTGLVLDGANTLLMVTGESGVTAQVEAYSIP